jgi:hypothetical protein
MPIITDSPLLPEPTVCYAGFGVIYNEEDHWLKPREFEAYNDTSLLMHYINPNQCIIVIRSSLHQTYHNEVLQINTSDTEHLQQVWSILPWPELVKTCPQTNVIQRKQPQWHMWMSPSMFVKA